VGDPSSIGRYEIVERVGRGGMGVLYRGRDPVLDREVAIKVMLADLSDDDEAKARFFKEARAAARLQHRNIVTVYEFGEADGNSYIAMEFLKGQSLVGRMRTPPPMTLDEKLDAVIQLCTGLHHAHSSGVIHRDVKPANVWVQPDGTVKLLDFGIARVAASTVTQGDKSFGSVAYMAPERFGRGTVDSRADIFAVGVVLYELLANRKPFDGDSPTVIAHRILQEAPDPIVLADTPISPGLASYVERSLAKDPNDRYQTAADLAADLQMARMELQSGGTVVAPPKAAPAGGPAMSGPQQGSMAGTMTGAAATLHGGATGQYQAEATMHGGGGPNKLAFGLVALVAVAALGVALWVGLRPRPAAEVTQKASEPVRAAAPAAAAASTSAKVRLRVESTPPGASISINGAAAGKLTPAEIDVDRGTKPQLRLALRGFTTVSKTLTPEELAAGRVAYQLEPARQDPVVVNVEGSYAFQIVEGGKVLSPAKQSHSLTVVGQHTIRLVAAEYLLDYAVNVDPANGRQATVEAPELGELHLSVVPALEACKASVGSKDLDYAPFAPVALAPGTYTVSLTCPAGAGRNRKESVTIKAGGPATVKIQ
jgi:hypothetical protein